jgi:hypothetical protein
MPATKEQLSKYTNNKIFIETGSLVGDGIQRALDAGFEKVISIECHQGYYETSKERFKDNDNVEVILGDSSKDLYDIIKDIDEPITFWLDAHYMWNDPNQDISNHPGNGYVPTYDELVQIEKHPIKTHTILIDDIVHLNNLAPRGEDPPTGTEDTLTPNLMKFVSGINEDYMFMTVNNSDGDFFECRV